MAGFDRNPPHWFIMICYRHAFTNVCENNAPVIWFISRSSVSCVQAAGKPAEKSSISQHDFHVGSSWFMLVRAGLAGGPA